MEDRQFFMLMPCNNTCMFFCTPFCDFFHSIYVNLAKDDSFRSSQLFKAQIISWWLELTFEVSETIKFKIFRFELWVLIYEPLRFFRFNSSKNHDFSKNGIDVWSKLIITFSRGKNSYNYNVFMAGRHLRPPFLPVWRTWNVILLDFFISKSSVIYFA